LAVTPYVVAELSANHNGSLSRALALVDAAADCGCDAIKLQTYTPDTMTLDYPYYAAGLWEGRTLYDLYREAQTPWEWHAPIFERARQKGLACISTPFSREAVDFLVGLGVDALKIASFEITDLELVRYAASKGKPLYISTGMATREEIIRALAMIDYVPVTLLKCTSAYPAPVSRMNLRTLTGGLWAQDFGLSDHTLGHTAAVCAVALGATVIEKHLTLSRADGGPDAAFSAEPQEMRELVRACRDAYAALGKVAYGPQAGENPYYRRSIIVAQDIKAGEVLTRENVRCLRPNIGMDAGEYRNVIGKRVGKDLKRGQGLQWSHLA
jgi:pseudaminic acid synthase